jgi:hypothetical protein
VVRGRRVPKPGTSASRSVIVMWTAGLQCAAAGHVAARGISWSWRGALRSPDTPPWGAESVGPPGGAFGEGPMRRNAAAAGMDT